VAENLRERARRKAGRGHAPPAGGLLACLAALLALVVSCGDSAASPAPAANAPVIHGWLHTEHGKLVAASGAPVRLLGVDEPGFVSGTGNLRTANPDACSDGWHPPPRSEFRNLRRWGFNSVRLGVSWANLEPHPPVAGAGGVVRHDWNRPYLAALDRAVTGFTHAGVAVVLDMHQNHMSPVFKQPAPDRCQGTGFPTWQYPDPGVGAERAECDFFADRTQPGVPIDIQDGYRAAWVEVARRYARNPLVVGVDLFNEPSAGKCPGLDVTPFYDALGRAVRGVAPHVLLICQDGVGRSGLYALQKPLSLPGWVYSFHLYVRPGDDPGAVMDARLDRAAGWGVPAWVGELGIYHRGHAVIAPAVASQDVRGAVAHLRERDAGWAFHQYAGGRFSLTRHSTGALGGDILAALQSGY
jgi:endoglycosylceramidase